MGEGDGVTELHERVAVAPLGSQGGGSAEAMGIGRIGGPGSGQLEALLEGFQCEAALLTASTPDLDELVGRGLREGAILIPEKEEVA